jgi:hypothetical protein
MMRISEDKRDTDTPTHQDQTKVQVVIFPPNAILLCDEKTTQLDGVQWEDRLVISTIVVTDLLPKKRRCPTSIFNSPSSESLWDNRNDGNV